MKNYNFLVLATLMTGALVTSCSKDDDDDSSSGKKIRAYVTIDGSEKDSSVFTYNGDNLVGYDSYEMLSGSYKKTYSAELEYTGSKLIKTYSYDWVGTNKKLVDKDSIAYDSKGRPEKEYDFDEVNGKLILDPEPTVTSYNDANQAYKFVFGSDEYQTFEYDATGNVTKVVDYYNNQISSTDNYTYDNKKNPIKGNPGFIGEVLYYSPNNPLTYSNEEYTKTYTYEYDAEGYPTKMTLVGKYINEDPETTVIKLYYK